jgi:hypothetical protein
MKKNWFLAVLVLFLLVDVGLTFVQNYHVRFDGDLPAITVPRADYSYILNDPFGWRVLTTNALYAVPNRFFAYAGMYWYFRQVPLWLQSFLSPISSAYAALALFNTLVHVLLLYVLGWYAAGTQCLRSRRLWLAMSLMAPFFQATGYHMQMSLVIPSVSFSFAYSFPLALLLVLLWPLYRAARLGQPLRLGVLPLLAILLLAIVLAFNGPIIPGVVLVLLLGVGLHTAWRWWLARPGPGAPLSSWLPRLPWQPVLVWGWLAALCLYSLYIGRNNAEDLLAAIPLWARYKLLPDGIFNQLTVRLGLPLLLIGCLFNGQLIRRQLPPSAEGQRLQQLLRWLGAFALVYIILLPLGGYRQYRPLLLRYDTVLPITVGLVWFYGLSTGYLLTKLSGRARRFYTGGVLVVAAIFINADRKLYPGDNNLCERQALELLARAKPGSVVRLPEDCHVLSWETPTTPLESVSGAEMLYHWGVTKGVTLYYYAAPKGPAVPLP